MEVGAGGSRQAEVAAKWRRLPPPPHAPLLAGRPVVPPQGPGGDLKVLGAPGAGLGPQGDPAGLTFIQPGDLGVGVGLCSAGLVSRLPPLG